MPFLTAVRALFAPPPSSEARTCDNGCGLVVAAERGVSDHHGVFCSTDCLDEWIDNRVY